LTPAEGALKLGNITNLEPVTVGPGASQMANEIEFKAQKRQLKNEKKSIFRKANSYEEASEKSKVVDQKRDSLFKNHLK
jgi:hypothetical protein